MSNQKAAPGPPFQTPQDALTAAQNQMFLLLSGQATQAIETPQLGRVQYHPTTAGDLQRLITYLQGLVQAGNVWPTDPSSGSISCIPGRKPFSFFAWP